jgi:hypothetical protein
MRKEILRGQLQTIKNNYALVQAGIMFLAQPDAAEKFDEYYSIIADHPEGQFGYIKYVFQSDDLLKLATNQLRKAVLRSCVKEMFEILKSGCETEDQKQSLMNAPWYQFLRMIRNSLSHDFYLRFNTYDKTRLPVTWAGLTLTQDMDGAELPMQGFFTRAKVQDLIDDVIRYVELNIG